MISEVIYDGTQTDEGDETTELMNVSAATTNLGNYKVGDGETQGGDESMCLIFNGMLLALNSAIFKPLWFLSQL